RQLDERIAASGEPLRDEHDLVIPGTGVAVPGTVREREPGQLLDRQQRVERDERAPVDAARPLRTRGRPSRRPPTAATPPPGPTRLAARAIPGSGSNPS